MPNRSGVWSLPQQYQAYGSQKWTQAPGAPTIGTATGSAASASVSFTAPSFAGNPGTITGYRVISSPGCVVATGSSSPITVSCLTNCTAYTFRVQAQNAIGYGDFSCSSNSATPAPIAPGQQAFTSPGSYCWTAPSGVTQVSVVTVGAGGGGSNYGASGGGLAYKNNISTSPGTSYSVVVGQGGIQYYGTNSCSQGGSSYITLGSVTVKATGGISSRNTSPTRGGPACCYDDGYLGGGVNGGAGGGAAGYSGCGGRGDTSGTASGGAGAGGSSGGGGGGVGILGEGTTGTHPAGGGSGGANGSCYQGGCGVCGGDYGGGAGGPNTQQGQVTGGGGAVRLIWGCGRAFPSTCTGNL